MPSYKPQPSSEYTWPVRLVWVSMALIFFGAGVSKIRHGGAEWITSDNLSILLVQHNYHVANAEPLKPWGLEVAKHPGLTRSAAGASVFVEAAYPLALISPTARMILVPGAFSMQLGIRTLMGPSFGQYLICNLFWIPWPWIGRRLLKSTGKRARYSVIFDGNCGFCQRTIAVIRKLDVFGRISFLDAYVDWPFIESKFPNLKQSQTLDRFHVLSEDERVVVGFYAYRRLAGTLPLLWPVQPLLYIPGVPFFGNRVYAWIANLRHRSGCSLPVKVRRA